MARRLTFEEAWRLGESLPPVWPSRVGRLLTTEEWQQLSRWRRFVAWFRLRHPVTDKERRRLGIR